MIETRGLKNVVIFLQSNKNLLSLNDLGKQSRLLKYCNISLLNLNEKDW